MRKLSKYKCFFSTNEQVHSGTAKKSLSNLFMVEFSKTVLLVTKDRLKNVYICVFVSVCVCVCTKLPAMRQRSSSCFFRLHDDLFRKGVSITIYAH